MKSKSYTLLHKQLINFLLFSFGEDVSGYVRDSYYYDYFDIYSEYNNSIVIDDSIVDADHLYILKYI